MHHKQVSTSGLHTLLLPLPGIFFLKIHMWLCKFLQVPAQRFSPRRPALPTLAKTEGPPRSCTSKNKLPNACARLWIEGNRTTFLSQLSYSRYQQALGLRLSAISLTFPTGREECPNHSQKQNYNVKKKKLLLLE